MTASPPIGLDQNTLMVELPSLVVTVKSMGGLATVAKKYHSLLEVKTIHSIPFILRCAESDDGLLFSTVHV